MRFLMINLLLVCLFLFGIGYLAFGYDEIIGDETVVPAEPRDHHTEEGPWGASFETLHKRLKTDVDLDLSEKEGIVNRIRVKSTHP